jgi:hypothetical protein
MPASIRTPWLFHKASFQARLKEVSLFFHGKDEVTKSLRRLVKRLEKANISYVVVGGMAVFAHGYKRTTNDVDILLTPKGFAEFQRVFVPKNYVPMVGRPRRFIDRTNKRTLDILVTGLFPGSGKPGPVAYPDPEEVAEKINNIQFLKLEALIELKLAARRYQDFADVVKLIDVHNLDESFADRLHPSVRGDYIECLEEKRREDEYEARN